MIFFAALLAQAPAQSASQILFWLGVIVVAAVVLGIVAWVLRRVLLREDEPAAGAGFGLPELREMRASGQLTEEEYENARRLLVARTRAASGVEASEKTGGEAAANNDQSGDSDKSGSDDPTDR